MTKTRVKIKQKVTNYGKNKQAILLLMGKAGKKRFSERDKAEIAKATEYKNEIAHLITELLKNSRPYQWLVEEDRGRWFLNLLIGLYVKAAFSIQVKKPKESRYVFDHETPAKILKQLFGEQRLHSNCYLHKVHQAISKLCRDLHEEKCCVCHEDFITPHDCKQGKKSVHRSDDFTDCLRCGHYIHDKCLFEIYLHQDLEEQLRCPMCRDYDKDHNYNKQRISILKKRRIEWWHTEYISQIVSYTN